MPGQSSAVPATSGLALSVGRFELRPAEGLLLDGGEPVKIGGRAFDMLVALVERAGHVVAKQELLERVWPGRVVEENNLQAQVVALRKLLGAQAIATVPGRGYRFVQAVQAREPGSGAGASPSVAIAAAVPPSRRGNLPRSVDPLIGRERELGQLVALIAEARLVTVTGTGGVGKTRLALEVATSVAPRFAEGAWLVELAALTDPDLVPGAAVGALGIDVPPGLDALQALVRQIGDRELLLVFDNCEHVIDAVAAVADAVMRAAPNTRVLASSQEPIGVAGETVFRLPSLALPASDLASADEALATGAVRLFVERARAADPGFVFDDRAAPAVTAICRRLDGIALAIEMAAARVPMLGVAQLERRLDERFRILTAGRRTALPRQRTLHATLDWSYGLLSDREQAVFRCLGVFAGSFSLDAAQAMARGEGGEEPDVIDPVAALCAKSLIVVDTGGAEARYRLLETARAYALERLAEAAETAAAMRAHALQCAGLFARCFDDWARLSDRQFAERYGPEIDNLRQALGWALGVDGDPPIALALAGSSARLWLALSLFEEYERILDQVLALPVAGSGAAVQADLWLAVSALQSGRDQARTVDAAQRAAQLYGQVGDGLRAGLALAVLAVARSNLSGPRGEAGSTVEEAARLLEASGLPRLRGLAGMARAQMLTMAGRTAEAEAHAQAVVALFEQAGADSAAVKALNMISDLVWMQGDLDRAVRAARAAIDRQCCTPFVDRVGRACLGGNLFGMLVERGDLAEAARMGRALLPELLAMRITLGAADHLASHALRRGDAEAAARIVAWADAQREQGKLRRQPNEQRAYEFVRSALRERLAEPRCAELWAQGAATQEDAIGEFALPSDGVAAAGHRPQITARSTSGRPAATRPGPSGARSRLR